MRQTLRFPDTLRVAAADDDTAAEVEVDDVGVADVEDIVVQVVRSFASSSEENLEKWALLGQKIEEFRWR